MWFAGLAALSACSDRPFAATDPEVFTSADYARPWSPSDEAREGLGSGVGALSRSEPMPLGVEVGGGRQSMLRLLDIALANRPQTRGAWEEARQAAAEYGIVQGAWLPTVGLEADFYYAREIYPATGEAFFVEQVAFIPQIALNYLLLDFGRREADDDRARAALWDQAQQRHHTMHWVHAAAENTGLPDQSFDFISLCLVAHELPQAITQAIFQEAHRLLTPGGHLAIMDMNPSCEFVKKLPPYVLTLLKSTEPYLDQYFGLDLATAAATAGLRTVHLSPNGPRHRTFIATKLPQPQ